MFSSFPLLDLPLWLLYHVFGSYNRKILDKAAGNRYTNKAVHSWHNDEIRSRAMGICEPCQVGNKAALNRSSHVP